MPFRIIITETATTIMNEIFHVALFPFPVETKSADQKLCAVIYGEERHLLLCRSKLNNIISKVLFV